MPSLSSLKFITFLFLVTVCILPNKTDAQEVLVAQTVAVLNLRQGPSLDFDIALKLDAQEQVIVTGRNEDGRWLYVMARGDTYTGWVSSRYISISDNTPIMQLPLIPIQNVNQPAQIPDAAITRDTSANGTTISNLNVRTENNTNGTILGFIPARTNVIIESRNPSGNWIVVHTMDNQLRGWVVSRYIDFNDDLSLIDIPVINSLTIPVPNSITSDVTDEQSVEEQGIQIPPENKQPPINLTESVLNNTQSIYQRGQQLGRQSNSFIVIGESNSVPTAVYCSLGQGRYSLGQFSYLQSTIDLFNTSDSFCRIYETARAGHNTSYIVDPFWANPSLCESNENPLLCEIRRRQPAFALIYIGIGDHAATTPELFASNLHMILQQLIDYGIIPVIFTYPMADVYNVEGTAVLYNDIIRENALSMNIPLVDLRTAAWDMNNRGTGSDGYHLSQQPNHFSRIDTEQYVYGRTLREYLTLEVLNQIIARLGI